MDHGLHPKPDDDEEDGVVGLSLLDDEDLVEKFKLLEDFITLAKFMLFLLDACFTFDSDLSLWIESRKLLGLECDATGGEGNVVTELVGDAVVVGIAKTEEKGKEPYSLTLAIISGWRRGDLWRLGGLTVAGVGLVNKRGRNALSSGKAFAKKIWSELCRRPAELCLT